MLEHINRHDRRNGQCPQEKCTDRHYSIRHNLSMRAYTFLLTALLAHLGTARPQASGGQVVLRDNYEGTAPNFNFEDHNIEGNGTITSVTSPVFEGKHAGKFMVPCDGSSFRAEVKTDSLGYGHFKFTFDTFLPADWAVTDLGTIISQWKTYSVWH